MDIQREAQKLIKENRRTTEGHRYTVPSAGHHPYQWLWDSCFHAIVLAKFEPEVAREEIRSLLCKQFENGMIPHIIYWTPGVLHRFPWGVEGTSSLSQPPMLAYTVNEIHRNDPDKAFLREVFPSLMKFYRFFIDERDARNVHLVGIINPDESGEDDSPRFDAPLGVPMDVTYKEHLAKRTELVNANREGYFDVETGGRDSFWVKDVPFNTILVENLRILAHMAALLERKEDEAYTKREAELIAGAMRTHMFEEGVYWSVMGTTHKKLKVHTWAHFVPLFAGLYSPEEAEHVIETHLRNEDTFKSPFGIRTVSRVEPAYRASTEYFSWRGPVWFGPHWFVYKGLVRYGYLDDARWVHDVSAELLERNGFRECFNPETGEAYGAKKFTWGCLVLDMT